MGKTSYHYNLPGITQKNSLREVDNCPKRKKSNIGFLTIILFTYPPEYIKKNSIRL